jgi:SAM-dependent methyltransferase
MLEATALAEDEHFWFIGLRRNAKQVLDRALRGRRAGLIVDCGAGTGRNLDWLAAYGSPVGVELTPAGLARGRARGRPMVRGTVTALPVADARAGLATSFDVLYCLEDADERRALAEMWRVLEPGGLALFNVAALDVLRERLDAAGFVTERMTFTNMATFPPTLAIRVFDRLTGRAAHASKADLRVPHPIVNRVFDLALRAEAAAMRVVDLPVGTSLMCLARKPGARVAVGLET